MDEIERKQNYIDPENFLLTTEIPKYHQQQQKLSNLSSSSTNNNSRRDSSNCRSTASTSSSTDSSSSSSSSDSSSSCSSEQPRNNGDAFALNKQKKETYQTEFEKIVHKPEMTLQTLKEEPMKRNDDKENECNEFGKRYRANDSTSNSPMAHSEDSNSQQPHTSEAVAAGSSTKAFLKLGFLGKAKKIKLKKDKPKKTRPEISDRNDTVKRKVGRPLKGGERAGDTIIVNSTIPPERRRMGRPPTKNLSSTDNNSGANTPMPNYGNVSYGNANYGNVIEITDSSDESDTKNPRDFQLIQQNYMQQNFQIHNYATQGNTSINNFPAQNCPVITPNFTVIHSMPQQQQLLVYQQQQQQTIQLPILKTAEVSEKIGEHPQKKRGRPLGSTKPKIMYTNERITKVDKIEQFSQYISKTETLQQCQPESESQSENESINPSGSSADQFQLKRRPGRQPGPYGKYKKSFSSLNSTRNVSMDDTLPPLESVLNGSATSKYENSFDEPIAEVIVNTSTPIEKKKGRGRPLGSTKPKLSNELSEMKYVHIQSTANNSINQGKRGRGRPLGSCKKKTPELNKYYYSSPGYSLNNESNNVELDSVKQEYQLHSSDLVNMPNMMPVKTEAAYMMPVKSEAANAMQCSGTQSESSSSSSDSSDSSSNENDDKTTSEKPESNQNSLYYPKPGRGRPRLYPPKIKSPSKRRGRPLGSLNKTTIMGVNKSQTTVQQPKQKRKRGRPAKDPTRQKMIHTSAYTIQHGPKKRGRKPGKYGKYKKTHPVPFNLADRKATLNIRKPNIPQLTRNTSISSSQADSQYGSSSDDDDDDDDDDDSSSSSSGSSSSYSENPGNQTFSGFTQQQNVIVEPVSQSFNGYEITQYEDDQYLDNIEVGLQEETVYEEYIGEDYEQFNDEQQQQQQQQIQPTQQQQQIQQQQPIQRIVETISLDDSDEDSEDEHQNIYNNYQEPEIII